VKSLLGENLWEWNWVTGKRLPIRRLVGKMGSWREDKIGKKYRSISKREGREG